MTELRIGIITSSDSCHRGERQDTAGPALADLCEARGWNVCSYHVCPDDKECIATSLVEMCDVEGIEVAITCGGTGFGPRDVAPEATVCVCERMAPGVAEAIRAESMRITPRAMLSRGVAGIRGHTLIVNLPGSEKAAKETFGFVADQLEHAVEMIGGGGHD
jgi:molybdopterin adenylyltransferase